jgi:glycosyltransferase involved in cell wall biosynthesis
MPNSGAGGIETMLTGLSALTRLDDGNEEYLFIGPWEEPDWLQSFLQPGAGRYKIVRGPRPVAPTEWEIDRLDPLKKALGPLRPLARNVKRLFTASASMKDSNPMSAAEGGAHVSSNFYENLRCDVIHFPFQFYTPCALPVVYNPHDLQHLHFPEFFEQSDIDFRETLYPAACHAAHTIIVASQFVKRDITRRYRVNPDKIQVITGPPPAPELSSPMADDLLRVTRTTYQLPDAPFALYPAMTWEHKNHLRLLEAVALLRDREALKVNLICTGARKSFWPRIRERVRELGLEEQVSFLGMVPREHLSALYLLAQYVIIPTLYEAASAPLFEAWQHNVPVACSTATMLPEQAGDGALIFDPFSVEAIATAVARMAIDVELRDDLRRRGASRLNDFSLERAVKAYRAVYRRAAGVNLNEEDRWLLGRDWTQGARAAVEVRSH